MSATPAPRVSPVTQVVAVGIGAALFLVLGRFAAIPTPIPNTTINIQYAVLAVFAVLYGPWVALLAGLIGHVLLDATGYGIWMSWEVASAVFGLIVGLILLRNHVREGEFGRGAIARFVVAVVVAHAVAWLVVAPVGDIVVYSEPAAKVFTQGALAFVVNALTTAILGSVILAIYARTRTRTGSLSVES